MVHLRSYSIAFTAENYIDGAEFLTLKESEVKAMVPPIGLARKIMRLLPHTLVIMVVCCTTTPT